MTNVSDIYHRIGIQMDGQFPTPDSVFAQAADGESVSVSYPQGSPLVWFSGSSVNWATKEFTRSEYENYYQNALNLFVQGLSISYSPLDRRVHVRFATTPCMKSSRSSFTVRIIHSSTTIHTRLLHTDRPQST